MWYLFDLIQKREDGLPLEYYLNNSKLWAMSQLHKVWILDGINMRDLKF